MSKNTTDFFQNTEITGALTPEQAAQLLELSAQGDTGPLTPQLPMGADVGANEGIETLRTD